MQPRQRKSSPHARFYAVFARMVGADKEDIIWDYSNKLTTSLNEFKEKNPSAYTAMLIDLEQKFPAAKQAAKPSSKAGKQAVSDETRKLRSGILKRLQKHGIDTTDWNCVNRFLENPKIAGKRMYNMTDDEMKSFIRKMESILAKDLEEKQQIETLSKLN